VHPIFHVFLVGKHHLSLLTSHVILTAISNAIFKLAAQQTQNSP
jgi:hypothetical protein